MHPIIFNKIFLNEITDNFAIYLYGNNITVFKFFNRHDTYRFLDRFYHDDRQLIILKFTNNWNTVIDHIDYFRVSGVVNITLGMVF